MKKISKDTQSTLWAILFIIGFIFSAVCFVYSLITVITTVGLVKILHLCIYFLVMCLMMTLLDKLAKE